ncbi:MAG: beta-ketoacyl-ACP reductase [Gammaproteobacteria bacterium]|jgi:3-oxoacyl-[acyl-carrier protein] reductase|nr:MAG: beta-ketoacyl-ACP reductase [Gammaproteobacteria bacterium]|tara:strand:- start:356 stop:1075 length:720 start_codon:yes stop_codon:yes gene_type:complete
MSKIVLVTGASRGIGLEAAKHFSKEGYKVIGSSRGDFNLGELIGDESAISVQLDLMSKESIKNLFADLKSEDLLPSVLVNNAGITKDQLFLRMKDEDWDDVIETNLNGLFRVTKAFIKPMVKNKFGRVINISSVAGLMGNSGQVNYSSSKSAMVGFSRSLAKELGSRNITSNVVAPGFIETDMTTFLNDDEKVEVSKNIPMKRFGTVQDVAKCIVFLASDEANYITGQTISVDGGLFMY